MRILQVFFNLQNSPHIREDPKSCNFLAFVVNNPAREADRDFMTVYLFDDNFVPQQLAFAAEIIAAHSFDQFIGNIFLLQSGYMKIGHGLFLGIAQQGLGPLIEKDNIPFHVRRND